MSIRFNSSTSFAALSLIFILGFSACSKINICGKEDKLVGDWVITEYRLGDDPWTPDDTVGVIPYSTLFPPVIEFTENGVFNYIFSGDTTAADTTVGSYRMERYETDCLLYIDIDLFDYRWEIKSLGSEMEINSFTLLPMDSLVETSLILLKQD